MEPAGPWRDYPTRRGVALAVFSLLAGLGWELGFWQADLGPTQENWPIWVLPAPLWAAAVAIVVARRRDPTRAVGAGLVAGVAAFGGGLLGVVVHLLVYGTGN
jgi:hypothetical protein